MRNLKRVLSLALALVMVLGMMVITTSAADYTDAEEITYKEAVEVMSAIGVINGNPDGTFAPKGTLTREQAAKILAFVTMGAEADEYLTGSAAPFDDVAATKWSAKYIAYCKNLGIINGVGDNKFNPAGTLKVVEFAKMLLVAAGIDGEYTGSNWANNVKNAVAKTEMKNTGIKITNAEITREEACALALAAMKSGGSTTTYYDVYDTNNVKVDSFTSIVDAYVLKDVIGGSVDTRIVTAGTLLADTHKVNYIPADEDAFKNPGVGYEKTVQGKKVIDLFFGEEAALTYTKSMNTVPGKKSIAADLEDLGVELTELDKAAGNYKFAETMYADVDGVTSGTLTRTTNKLAQLTGDNAVVKVYVEDKAVTKITVSYTYTDKVASVTEADEENETPAYVTLTDTNTFDTEAFAENDIVLYTIANGKVQTMVKAESVTGTLTGYNSDNEYTIGGETYKVGAGADTSDSAVKALINKTKVWYLGVDGGIVAVGNVPGDKPVAPSTTYALITDAVAVADSTPDPFDPENPIINGYDVKVKAVLSDGTQGTYALTAYKNEAKAWVVKVGQEEIAATSVATLKDNFYPYTLADGVLTLNTKLGVFYGNEEADAVLYRVNKNAIDKTSTTIVTKAADATVIANSETVFILCKDDSDPSKGLVVKTGLAALEGTTIAGSAASVIVAVDYNEKTSTATNVAKVVYATGTEFSATGAVDTTDYIYVDGKYSYAKAEDGTETYTGTAVKVDGTTVTVTGANKDAGIYVLMSDGSVGDAVANTGKVTVGNVVGSTYDIGGYVTVNANTKVISVAAGAALEKGAEAYAITANGVASVVFVVKAAPAN